MKTTGSKAAFAAMFNLVIMGMLAAPSFAQVTWDFETPGQIEDNSETSGDFNQWIETTDQALTGTKSLKVTGANTKSFQNFTYSAPFAIETGTISVWFYDTVGQGLGSYTWSGSIILENASDPTDFIAVEIVDALFGPPGSGRYWATEGLGDRGVTSDRIETGDLAIRTVGWHQVVFNITPTITDVSVDGSSTSSVSDARGPGGTGTTWRLRIMADSATVGSNTGLWSTAASGYPGAPGAFLVDDVTFTATTPAVQTDRLDFEDLDVTGLGNASGKPEYDTVAEVMGPAAYNETNMRGFVNTFDTVTTQAHSGTNSVSFVNGDVPFRRLEVDLSTVDSGPVTITIPFYDSLGNDVAADKIGGSFIIEDGTNPLNFIAAEVWNFTYPSSETAKNYYFVARPIPFGSGFYSQYFGDRTPGWQTLVITLTETQSTMTINGIGANNGPGGGGAVYTGPGLNTNPKLIIMADSASMGGFNSWRNSAGWTDPQSPELDVLYESKNATYLYLDNIQVPLAPVTSVEEWMSFE